MNNFIDGLFDAVLFVFRILFSVFTLVLNAVLVVVLGIGSVFIILFSTFASKKSNDKRGEL